MAPSDRERKLAHQLDVERWRNEARDARRYRRLMAVIESAEGVRDWLALPARAVQELRRPSQIPPRPTPPSPVDEEEVELEELDRRIAEATEAFARGDDAPALELAVECMPLAATDNRAWRFARTIFIRSGEISLLRRLFVQRAAARPSQNVDRALAKELGRSRELDVRWLPRYQHGRGFDPVPGRVLHIIKESAPYLTNGYTMRSAYTVASQQAAGLDPVVVTSLGFPRNVTGEPPAATVEEVAGVRHHRLDLGPAYPYGSRAWDELLEDAMTVIQPIVEDERPQIVQAGSGFRGIETALLGLAIARRYGLPFVYEVRSFLEHTWTGELDRAERGEHFRARSRREEQLMMEADHVITIAHAMKADLVSRGIPADHVSIVPNGVDTTDFTPLVADEQLRASLGLPADHLVVGYVSNLGQREGLDVLVDAILEVRAAGEQVTGLIVGEGPMRSALERQLQDAGDPAAVVMPGRVPHAEIRDYYALIDVFVIPRLDDRAARLVTPLKPFEAMALARPMVVSDLPALREITEPEERGLSFPAGDAPALAAVIRRLVHDPELRETLGRNGRRWVEAERDWSMNGPRYREIFTEHLQVELEGTSDARA